MKFVGKAHVYGDNIDTDRIIPGKYTKTLDLQQLADHVLEDLDPNSAKKCKKGIFSSRATISDAGHLVNKRHWRLKRPAYPSSSPIILRESFSATRSTSA